MEEDKFYFNEEDLTIRMQLNSESNLKSDDESYIVADMKPSVGITQSDIQSGVLSKHNVNSYYNNNGSNQDGFMEAVANGHRIVELLNSSAEINKLKTYKSLLDSVLETNKVLKDRLLQYDID